MKNNELEINDKMERWGELTVYGRTFRVSDRGRIVAAPYWKEVRGRYGGKMIRFFPEKEMSQIDDGNGYKYISFRNGNEHKNLYVHRAVALIFCEGYEEGLVVNHKDYNRDNNDYRNLEWCTQKYNAIHGTRNKRKRYRTSFKSTNTGERYITKRSGSCGDRFRVCFWKKGEKSFETLDEAIAYRDGVLAEEENGRK